MIYLSELKKQENPETESRAKKLRLSIESAWGRAFDWLGKAEKPLDEDDFLLHHTSMYFGSLPKEKEALDLLLFKRKFSTDRLASNHDDPLTLADLEAYVASISKSAELWAFQNSSITKLSDSPLWANDEVVDWLCRLNRVGMRHEI